MKVVNANRVAGPDGADGQFQVQVVTEDDRRHVLAVGPAAMAVLVVLARADPVLAWDPTSRTLVAANVVGTMPWTERVPGPHWPQSAWARPVHVPRPAA